MTNRHPPHGTLRAWRVERAPGTPEMTQAGRISVPVRLRRVGSRVCVAETTLVLTAEDAQALRDELANLLRLDEQEAS